MPGQLRNEAPIKGARPLGWGSVLRAVQAAVLLGHCTVSPPPFSPPHPAGQLAQTLQQVQVGLIDSSVCNAANAYQGDVTEKMLCAGGGGADTCQVCSPWGQEGAWPSVESRGSPQAPACQPDPSPAFPDPSAEGATVGFLQTQAPRRPPTAASPPPSRETAEGH